MKDYIEYKGNSKELELSFISTSIKEFDDMLGSGLPRDRLIEFYGQRKSGKTSMVLKIIANTNTEQCCYVDVEKSYVENRAKILGVDVSKLEVIRPKTGEGGMKAILNRLEQNYNIIALDSIAALVPSALLDDAGGIASLARIVNEYVKVINLRNQSTVVLFVNQIRSKIGSPFGESVRPGGAQLDFLASHIVKFTRTKNLLRGKKELGIRTKILVEKNKIEPSKEDVWNYFDILLNGEIKIANVREEKNE